MFNLVIDQSEVKGRREEGIEQVSKLTKTNKLTTTNACNNKTAMARFEQKKIGNKSQCILSLLRRFLLYLYHVTCMLECVDFI